MASYAVSNTMATGAQVALTSSFQTQLSVNAATGATTLRRGWIMEWEIGADNIPNSNDCAITWSIEVMTAAGTANSTPVPNPNDIGGSDAAPLLVYKANYTAEPTVAANGTSQLWYLPLNQRASYRIQMRDNVSAIIVPAVNLKGPVFRAKSTNYASTVGTRCLIWE